MKVVLFCGGLGLRLRDYSESVPSHGAHRLPAILWHIMKYYTRTSATRLHPLLGWRGDVIKQYFLNYNECLTNDFVLSAGSRLELAPSRHPRLEHHLRRHGRHVQHRRPPEGRRALPGGDEVFLAIRRQRLRFPPPLLLRFARRSQATAAFLSVRRPDFHPCRWAPAATSSPSLGPDSDVWINGGFFVFRREIFDYIHDGEELIENPSPPDRRAQLVSLRHDGFWACMDTYKEKQQLDDMEARGEAPGSLVRPAPRRTAGVAGQAAERGARPSCPRVMTAVADLC